MTQDTFVDSGFLAPAAVLGDGERRLLLEVLSDADRLPALEWEKSLATTVPLLHDVAAYSSILDPVARLLGGNVILWGATVVSRTPGQIHRYHTDIETSDPEARAVSVWVGLCNTTRGSSLRLVSRSHRFGLSTQEAAFEAGLRRDDLDDASVLDLARERDPASEIVELDMSDGDAVWFDGHLWHASENVTDTTRTALLLQYAAAHTPIRIPDLSRLEWPLRSMPAPRPPCIVMRGDAETGVNRLVPPPPEAGELPTASSWIHPLELPLDRDVESGWRPHPIFRVATPNTATLGCHVSVLEAGVSPHPPHLHEEEEILVVLDGTAELLLERGGSRTTMPVGAGDVAYYPKGQAHSLRATVDGPVTYLMLKWSDESRRAPRALDTVVVPTSKVAVPSGEGGFGTHVVFEGATDVLRLLHCHVSELAPGAGYEPHVDAHDVVILTLEGTVETLGTEVAAPAVILCSGGSPHGILNSGAGSARYLVFEFHRGDRVVETADEPPMVEVAPTVPASPRRNRIWRAGARALEPFPRVKRRLRRLLRPIVP